MSQYADPVMAFLLEPVTLEYIRNALTQEGVPHIVTPQGEHLYRLGIGPLRVLVAAGFSLYDYRIVNGLALLSLYTTRVARHVRVLDRETMRNISLYLCFPVNKFAYSRAIVMNKQYRRSLLDESGVPVVADALTLQSTHTSVLHQLVNELQPDVLVFLYTDKVLEMYTPEVRARERPLIYVSSRDREVETRLSEMLQQIADVDVKVTEFRDVQLVHSHFHLESIPTTTIVTVVPAETFESSIRVAELVTEIATTCSTLRQELESCRSKKPRREQVRAAIVRVEVPPLARQIARILELHGLGVDVEDEGRLHVKYYDDVPLHRLLFTQRLIESYFNVEIEELRGSAE